MGESKFYRGRRASVILATGSWLRMQLLYKKCLRPQLSLTQKRWELYSNTSIVQTYISAKWYAFSSRIYYLSKKWHSWIPKLNIKSTDFQMRIAFRWAEYHKIFTQLAIANFDGGGGGGDNRDKTTPSERGVLRFSMSFKRLVLSTPWQAQLFSFRALHMARSPWQSPGSDVAKNSRVPLLLTARGHLINWVNCFSLCENEDLRC